ncbi:hypothetical protein DXG01_013932 [Tephrocybe rancida]|nr:hypothetical protein DXG01_013932 [Tephrocybe rancida]
MSTVEETLARCPRFRILVVGNSGVGKSSLISKIFNVRREVNLPPGSFSKTTYGEQDIDIADDRAGDLDLDRGYISDDNPCIILHDSKGLEPGRTDNWDIVKEFICQRCKKGSIENQLHAIWLCVETPRAGHRLMQTADEDLLKLAISLKVPVIVVFTKYDLLVNQYYSSMDKRGGEQINASELQPRAEKEAQSSLDASIKDFQQHAKLLDRFPQLRNPFQRPINFVPVSTEEKYHDFPKMLLDLTKITQKCLRAKETLVPWAVAQRIDPKQKVECSLEEGFKSTYFPRAVTSRNLHQRLPVVSALAENFGNISPPPALALGAAGLPVVAIEFLYKTYQAVPQAALCLGAYIIDLTLVLHELFVTGLEEQRLQPLTSELISETLKCYKDSRSEHVHRFIRSSIPSAREAVSGTNKENFAELILRLAGADVSVVGHHQENGPIKISLDGSIV